MDSRGRLLGKKSKRPCSNAWPYHLGRKKKKQRNEGHHFSYSGFTMLKNEHPCSKLLRFRNVKPCRGFCMQPASRFSHGGTYLYISHVGLSRQAGTTGAWTAKFRSTGMSAGKTNCTEMGVRISSLPFNRDGTRKKKVVWESQRLQNSINFGFNLCAKLLNSRSCHHISSLLLLRWYFIFFKGPFFFNGHTHLNLIHYCARATRGIYTACMQHRNWLQVFKLFFLPFATPFTRSWYEFPLLAVNSTCGMQVGGPMTCWCSNIGKTMEIQRL